MSRKLTYLIAFVLLLGLSARTEGAAEVAHWRLDNDATDSVGNINGTLMNGAGFTTDAMVGSHALALDGTDDYVDFGNPQTLPSGYAERSMCGWGRTDTVAAGWAWIASYGTGGAAAGNAMCLGRNATTLYGAGMYDDIPVSGFWEVGVWHHICLTYDGTTAVLYADGVEVASMAKSWNLVLNNVYFGRQCYHTGENWDGTIDDVHIYSRVLTPKQVDDLSNGIPPNFKKAYEPSPADGVANVMSPLMTWKSGETAKFHDIYFGTNPTPGAAEFKPPRQPLAWALYYHLEPLVPQATYYWRVDEVEADGTTIHTGDVWSFRAAGLPACDPNPPDGAKYVATDVGLSWFPGATAVTHDVYFGTDETAVTDGTGSTFKGNLVTETYDPGVLALDTTYYWRIDEVELNTTTKHTGEVWRFKTRPDMPISDPNLVAWWKLDEGQGTAALDWSGYGHDGTLLNGPQWVVGVDGGALEFDGSDDYVDFGNPSDLPSGTSARSLCGWGKTDSVAAGWTWIAAYGTNATSQAMFIGKGSDGDDLYGGGYGDDVYMADYWEVGEWHHICLTYDGGMARLYADGFQVASAAKTWNLALSRVLIGRQVNTAAEFWNGQIDDVRIYAKALTLAEIKEAMRGDPLLAWNPNPPSGSTPDIEHAEPITWSAGDMAAKHDVYFGTDRDAVEDADTTTTGVYRGRIDPNSYTPPEALEWGQTYYWRIDEYNTDATISEGRVWGYTVADYLLVDDFEPYDDNCNRIFYAWGDGWGHSGLVSCGVLPYGGNGTGSTVGYLDAPYAERTIVHEGLQAMPMEYVNDGSTGKALYSETERAFDPPQDWTRHDVKALTLWFRGYPASVGSFSYDPVPDIYTMTADGWDISGTADGFHYAYKRLSSAGNIQAQVLGMANTSGWAKAGVMIREDLDPNSAHAMTFVTPGNGVVFEYRPGKGQANVGAAGQQTGITAPHWVRISRSANDFTSEHSADGATWETLGTPVSFPMAADVYVGLELSSGNTALTCEAQFSDVTITGTVTGQWQSQDIGISSNDAEQLYVVVEDSVGQRKVVNHPDPDAVASDTYQEWNIDLKEVGDAGVNLQSIKKMYIGLGDRAIPKLGGGGMLYVDDIRLYPPRCLFDLAKPAGSYNDDCVVDYLDVDIMTANWLADTYDVTPDGSGLSSGLIAQYKLDGNANDSAGSNHGTKMGVGAAVYTTDSMQGTNAIVLDGIDDYVDFGSPPSWPSGTSARSMCGWAKTDTVAAGWRWIAAYGTGGTSQAMFIGMNGADLYGGGYGDDVSEDDFWEVDVWHHICLTYDGSTARMYTDGNLVASEAKDWDLGLSLAHIGRQVNTAAEFWDGLVDDVRIYSRALSQGEVASLAGKTATFTQPLHLLLTPPDPNINLHDDDTIDLKDYALLADMFLDEVLWP